MELDLLKKIVGIAQEKIARDSIRLLQAQAEMVNLKTHVDSRTIRIVAKNILQLESSCAFYNLKAIMLRAHQMEIPVLLKEHGVKNPMGIYFRENELLNECLKPDQSILVIECFFPKGCEKESLVKGIQGCGLLEIVLANVACTPQYSAHDDISRLDQEEQDEILKFRNLGIELGCQTASPVVFSIAHIHAATVKEEKVI